MYICAGKRLKLWTLPARWIGGLVRTATTQENLIIHCLVLRTLYIFGLGPEATCAGAPKLKKTIENPYKP